MRCYSGDTFCYANSGPFSFVMSSTISVIEPKPNNTDSSFYDQDNSLLRLLDTKLKSIGLALVQTFPQTDILTSRLTYTIKTVNTETQYEQIQLVEYYTKIQTL